MWRGSVSITGAPRLELSVGTSRQPRSWKPFGLGRALNHGLTIDALRLVPRHEQMADCVVTGLRQGDAQRCAHNLQKFMRHLHEHARTVSGERVGADRAAMS